MSKSILKLAKSEDEQTVVTQTTSETEAFQMIELASGDLESLARAFEIIAAACKGESETVVEAPVVLQ